MSSKPANVPDHVEHFGHASRAGHTEEQHEEHFEYDFSASGAFPHPPKFDGDKHKEREYLKGRLAMGYRLFAKWGFDEGVAGHISMRVRLSSDNHGSAKLLTWTKDPVEPDTLWINPFGTSFALMKRSDLIRINHDGKVLEGGKNRLVNRAATMIHAAGKT